jgi:hypothetical protein
MSINSKIYVEAGTVSQPGVAFRGTTVAGISAASGNISLTTAGVEKLKLDTSGILTLPAYAGNSGKYLKMDASGVLSADTPAIGGAGDVVGPAISVNNTIPRFDSTTGKVFKTSSVLINDDNSVSGVPALLLSTDNTFIGKDINPTGTQNLFAGSTSGFGSSGTGNINNVCLGYYAKNGSSANNISIGAAAGAIYTTGGSNICIGYGSGELITTGSNNIYLGDSAKSTNAAFSNSVGIGSNCRVRASNEVVIGTTATTHMRPDDTDVTDLGTPSYKYKNIQMSGDIYKNGALFSGGGSFSVLTNFKLQYPGSAVSTYNTLYATKTIDMVTIYFPLMTVPTTATSNEIVSNYITLPKALPLSFVVQPVLIDSTVIACVLSDSGGFFFKFVRLSGSWTAVTNNIYSFTLTYRSANSTPLNNTMAQIGTGEPALLPSVLTYTPAIDSTTAGIGSDLSLVFDKSMVADTISIVINRYSDDSIVETITSVTFSQITVLNDTVIINPTSNLVNGTQYYVTISGTSLKTSTGIFYGGISSKDTWKFTTLI